jgi:hypothetical protein
MHVSSRMFYEVLVVKKSSIGCCFIITLSVALGRVLKPRQQYVIDGELMEVTDQPFN